MKALLDTHVFLWWSLGAESKLSDKAQDFINDEANDIFLSIASTWEISIKYRLGKLPIPEPPDVYIPARITLSKFIVLPILLQHSVETYKLPEIHKDPFDRLLIAQSLVEGMPLITADNHIQQYPIDIIW